MAHSIAELTERALSDDFAVARSAFDVLETSKDPDAEAALWNVLIKGGHKKHACATLLKRRKADALATRLIDRGESEEDASATWIRALTTLDDARIAAPLAEALHEAADLISPPPWDAITVGMDALRKLAGDGAAVPFARMAAELPGHARELALHALLALGPGAEAAWRKLFVGDDHEMQVEAAWGLYALGDREHVIGQLDELAYVFAPRMVKLGEPGIRVLCGAEVDKGEESECWGMVIEALFDDAVDHTALLKELAAGGSKVAELTLERKARGG